MLIKKPAWAAIILIQALLLVSATIRPLSLPDEGRYADIGRWMFMTGDWLIPRLNGIPFFHKPPLLYWLEAEAFHIFGIGVWSARLVPAIHAFMMLIGLYWSARHVKGEGFALRVTLVLGTSIGFLIGGQYINHDFPVATWITIAIGLFALAFQSPKTNLTLARLGFMACGLGFLSKGLIGIVLPGTVILVWLGMLGQLRRSVQLPWISGSALFLCMTLPWLMKVQSQFPDFLNYFIVEQHFSRFTGNHFNSQQPWWFYLPVIGIYVFPWGFLLIWDVIHRIKSHSFKAFFNQRSQDPWIVLSWVWLLAILLFFSIPKSKLMGYILPVLVPLAILIVHSWDRIAAGKAWRKFGFSALCGISVFLALGANFLARHNSLKDASLDTAHQLSCRLKPSDMVYMVGAYPYDVPFSANLQKPLILIQDWDEARKHSTDDWRRTFFEGTNFDPATAQILQSAQALDEAPADGSAWLVSPREYQMAQPNNAWHVVFKGQSTWLWQTGKSGTEVTNSSPAPEQLDCQP